MFRHLLVVSIAVALMGCSETRTLTPNPVSPPPTTLLDGFAVAQPIYDISDGLLYFGVVPQFSHPQNVLLDSMWVNIKTYNSSAPVQALVLIPKTPPFSWAVSAGFADYLEATICFKWQAPTWSETTFVQTFGIVAQP